MNRGFIFNHNKCVACGACSAACILENEWAVHARSIFTYNSEAFPSLPIINISLACNHCETAVCLEGCPTDSYYRDTLSRAVLLDGKKCIGCKYCQWNCPYDAPKFNTEKGIIEKCNLCYSVLIEGRLPACTTGCPTGALKYGELSEQLQESIPHMIPDKNLNPSIEFKGCQKLIPPRIIPENIFRSGSSGTGAKNQNISIEWSLFVFSFLTTLSVTAIISSLIKGQFPEKILSVSIIIFAGIISLFHLGQKMRAWRTVFNLRTSPLSREVAIFIIYSTVCLISAFLHLPGFLVVSSVIGLILLIAIDSVYIYADKRKKIIFHSGQTFISGLLIVSFLTGNIISFIFIAILKLTSTVYNLFVNKLNGINFTVRFVRIIILLVTGTSLVSGISFNDPVIIYLFLTGELFDRIIFYIDFDPLNINKLL
jgi:anaerobic dimethyl sulfoxide reductase subunit B (iron-sulfur subunit)